MSELLAELHRLIDRNQVERQTFVHAAIRWSRQATAVDGGSTNDHGDVPPTAPAMPQPPAAAAVTAIASAARAAGVPKVATVAAATATVVPPATVAPMVGSHNGHPKLHALLAETYWHGMDTLLPCGLL